MPKHWVPNTAQPLAGFVVRFSKFNIGRSGGVNTAVVDRLTLDEDGEALRWFYLPFQTASPRLPTELGWSNPSTTIITPKVYPGRQQPPHKDSE